MIQSPEVREWRQAKRAELLARRIAVPLSQRRLWTRAITAHLLDGLPMLRGPMVRGLVIGCYWPFKAEFDPRHAAREWRRQGARIALPVVVRKDAPLQFRAWWPGAPMTTGVWGIPIPDATDLVVPQALLIPPVGFDAAGYRLGYGGGFYDRTLAAMHPRPLAIGVGYELSRMDTIRPQPGDVPMDVIVTEAGVQSPSDRRPGDGRSSRTAP
ncbi:MAG: 5-formyltetrahydrofolate cyclo-ligase [Lautropia sp.]